MNQKTIETFLEISQIHLYGNPKTEKKQLNIGTICQGYHQDTHPHHCKLHDNNPYLICNYLEINGIHKEGYCLYKKKK